MWNRARRHRITFVANEGRETSRAALPPRPSGSRRREVARDVQDQVRGAGAGLEEREHRDIIRVGRQRHDGAVGEGRLAALAPTGTPHLPCTWKSRVALALRAGPSPALRVSVSRHGVTA